MDDDTDFRQLSDPQFLAERRRVREELEHKPTAQLTVRYEQLNQEFLHRARLAWRSEASATAVVSTLPRDAARMLAVETLLAEPTALGDDVLESCLYLLRERLTPPQENVAGEPSNGS